MEIRNRFTVIPRKPFYTKGPSKTKQEFRDECNINKIMERYHKNGILPDMIKENPIYGDFSEAKSYQESLDIVLKAEEQFRSLSADIRDRFNQDPAKFLEFTNDEKNKEEMAKMGLLKPEVVEAMKKANAVPQLEEKAKENVK